MNPKLAARYDELVNKEAFGSITKTELKELNDLQFSYEKRNADQPCPQCAEKDLAIASLDQEIDSTGRVLQRLQDERDVLKAQCAEKDAEIAKINGWREELRLKLRRVQNDYSVMELERNEAFKCLRIAREALNRIQEYEDSEDAESTYQSVVTTISQKALEQIGEKE